MSTLQLLTSVRYDPGLLSVEWNARANDGLPTPIFLLRYHVDRLADAATQHGWTSCLAGLTPAAFISACDNAVAEAESSSNSTGTVLPSNTPYKIRVLLNQDGSLTANATALKQSTHNRDLFDPPEDEKDTTRVIYLDPEPTPSSIFTSTKTTHRTHYNAARARVGLSPIPSPSDSHIDVVLHTPDGHLTETSIRNIAFSRDGKWVTPHARTSGCLAGVVRRWLIEQGRWIEAHEGELLTQDVQEGELVMTANGVEGCYFGRIAFFFTPPRSE